MPSTTSTPIYPPAAPAGGYPPQPPAGYRPPQGGYRPPFAPYGPYAKVPPPPPIAPPRLRRRQKPPRERSRLGSLVFSLLCLVLGASVVIDLTFGGIPVSAYFAAALAVVGIGLLISAWIGRARWLIVIGILLTGALTISTLVEADSFDPYRDPDRVWQPASLSELDSMYSIGAGNATLDLRDIDFAASTQPVAVNVHVGFGRLQVILPPNTDVDITAKVDGAGDAFVLGRRWGGFDTPSRRVEDNGPDGPGGGKLILDATINAGNVEVTR